MKLRKQMLLLSLLMMTAGSVFTACQNDVVTPTDTVDGTKEDFGKYTGQEIELDLESILPAQEAPGTRALKELERERRRKALYGLYKDDGCR